MSDKIITLPVVRVERLEEGSGESIFGFFDAPKQTKPAYHPGRGVLCPFCMKVLGDGDVRSTSLMLPGDHRSYFYQYHFGCYDEKAAADIEGALIDSRSRAASR